MPFTASFVHSLYIVALFPAFRKPQSVTVKIRALWRLFAQIRPFCLPAGILSNSGEKRRHGPHVAKFGYSGAVSRLAFLLLLCYNIAVVVQVEIFGTKKAAGVSACGSFLRLFALFRAF